METGQILILLAVLAYVILYFRGRYYKRENYADMVANTRVNVIGSGNY